MDNIPNVSPFGWRDKIGYMIGNAANDFTFVFAALFLQVFYTDVLKINTAIVGTMFLLSRVIDAVTDTVMGRIADKTKMRKGGKFKQWLLWISGPVAISSFLMYQSSVADAPMALKIVYMFTTYIFWGSICYTAINIPYGSMASVISSEADHRSSLSAFRGIGSILPQIFIGILMPLFLYTTSPDGRRIVNAQAFPIAAGLLSLAAAAGYIICYFMCTERLKPEENRKKVSLKETVKMLFKSRALIAICAVYICFLGAQMLNQTINNYIFKDYFSNTLGLTVMNAAGFIPMLVLSPLAVPISKNIGKKEFGVFASFVGAAAFALLFVIKTTNMWIYILFNVIGLMGFGIFNLIIWAFIGDVIDDCKLSFGQRDDGTIYAVCSFSRKVGQAIASGIGGWSLAWIGYSEGAISGQTEAVKNGIYSIATAVPTVLYFTVGLLLLFVYPLSKNKVIANISALKAKKPD